MGLCLGCDSDRSRTNSVSPEDDTCITIVAPSSSEREHYGRRRERDQSSERRHHRAHRRRLSSRSPSSDSSRRRRPRPRPRHHYRDSYANSHHQEKEEEEEEVRGAALACLALVPPLAISSPSVYPTPTTLLSSLSCFSSAPHLYTTTSIPPHPVLSPISFRSVMPSSSLPPFIP
ncbi:hypothetical protein Pcinc_018338 [Petrolisthes cinctipes]|uniref:Uncharacterized protein n=1 Tax=Petrolisthes cinctipes TaxID=88211 RepID=A0AAE1KMK9_PETCI|nr:hypothetical protein Pcinc_018338 [Petrolisthes cinctipes]